MISPAVPDSRRLSAATLADLPQEVAVPDYDRAGTRIGIVHFGPGAFHRAHQAAYIDALLGSDPDWAISAVSLHSAGVRDALRPQDGLYTLALLGQAPQLRVIGAIREVLCARDEGHAVLERLADPQVRLVTLTITEKGYCLSADGVDASHPDIVRDLATPDVPVSAIGWLAAGLRLRRDRGLAPYTVLSCDNLADNGGRLRRAVLDYTRRLDPELAAWIEREAAFPRSMVDSITPATDDALRAQVAMGLGVADAWPVQREPYTQWVVEDDFRNGRPPLERVGVTLSGDIAGYDRAKLRLLNAPHSALAYLGALMEIETVADAMREPALAGFVERLMREDIAPSLALPQGFDPDAYVDAILARFRNPAIRHLLLQIAWDGSQKLPVRLLGTLADALAAGRSIDRLCLPVAGWMHFVRRQARRDVALVDPLAETLAGIDHSADADAARDVDAFLRLDAVFAPLSADARFADALRRAYATLGDATPAAVARALAGAESR
ncbi:mannitol dehydrogenase [Pseudoxanthomonas broegbernensis]|uniref:Mannitol dehydrogenase n=1 Tax=Pseudoxanthomonas broegbernensis TaxID=83619 RepID=A0A7V8GKR0_9GAMM|nr:mannitol dehydrogenase family protein [Pseudoxanthomonas broegbernensis]KAF1685317.1 mannitol dehydrogenase [Pseudoxanthomonas broegbernensis]MBB6066184.1 fructuronate reductase [Pseudoxanthomonas broegbernensis]